MTSSCFYLFPYTFLTLILNFSIEQWPKWFEKLSRTCSPSHQHPFWWTDVLISNAVFTTSFVGVQQ